MKSLHPTQQKLLDLLKINLESPLTIRELQDRLALSSPSVVHHHIQQLERKGHLKRNPGNPRDYIVLGTPERAIVYLNLYGLASCGPTGSILDGVPADRIPIASRLLKFPSEDAFIVEARGDSMLPKIKPGDLIIARRQNFAANGEMVVCVNESEVLVKNYARKGETILLNSLNEKYEPFEAGKDFRIEGVVKNILHYD